MDKSLITFALRAAAAALEGPPDRQNPNEALTLIRRALREIKKTNKK